MNKKILNWCPRSSKKDILSDYKRAGSEEWTAFQRASDETEIGQAEVLIKIERFVKFVISTRAPAFFMMQRQEGGCEPIETALGRRLVVLIPYLRMFDSKHTYSEHIVAFLDAGWITEGFYGINLAEAINEFPSSLLAFAEAANVMVEKIRMNAREPWFFRGRSDRRYEAGYRTDVIADYTRQILRYYARTLVLRIDASYRIESRRILTIDKVYEHLDRLLYLKDVHPAFFGLVGYAWSVEQGERDGFHLHLVFFFDGSKVCQDRAKGFEIGALWKHVITGGAGTFENCNANKDRYGIRVGVGMIYRASLPSCANTVDCVQYVTKGGRFLDRDNQFLRIKPAGRRIFGTGHAPDIEQKRGRPAEAAQW